MIINSIIFFQLFRDRLLKKKIQLKRKHALFIKNHVIYFIDI